MTGGAARFRVVITDPFGIRHDVSRFVIGNAMSNLSEATDEQLLQFVHNDITLTLDDRDGTFTRMFGDAQPGEIYDVQIDRWTGGRRMKWERVFGGIPDFPWSVELDAYARTCSLQVFAYTKKLELASAEGYRRTVEGRTATVGAGSKTVTVSDTTDLAPEDAITLSSGSSNEQQVIATVDSPTQVTTKVAFTSAFTSAPLTLDTPYHRGKTASQIAADLFALAGVRFGGVTLPEELSSVPFPTPINTAGLPTGSPTSVLEKGGQFVVYQGGNKYVTSDPATGFAGAGAAAAQADWRPQLASEPGATQPFCSNRIYDYVDAAHPYYWWTAVTNGGSKELWITKNGANWTMVTSKIIPNRGGTFTNVYIEVAPWGEVWCSYEWFGQSESGPIDNRVVRNVITTETDRVNTTTQAVASVNSWVGPLCASVTRMAHFQAETRTVDPDLGPITTSDGAGIVIYIGGYPALTLDYVAGCVAATFRAFSTFYACVSPGYVHVWRQEDGVKEASYQISSVGGSTHVATAFRGGLAADEYEGYTGNKWFSLSKRASGVIPYADCEGKSCAAALSQLALVTAGVLDVSAFGTGRLVARILAVDSSAPIELGVPLRKTARPVWEFYRTAVVVTGKDDLGGDLELRLGDTGESARKLDVSLAWPVSIGLGNALGNAYLGWFSVVRKQVQATVREGDRLARLFSLVRLLGTIWRVLRADSDLYGRQQSLLLAEEI